MAKMGNDIVATHKINGRLFDVYECWDDNSGEESYSVHERESDAHLNEGNPFDRAPTEDEVRELAQADGWR